MRRLFALICKESLEDFLAARGGFFFLIASIVLSAFSVLLVSDTENSSLLDNAEAVYFMTAIILTLACLIAIIRGSDGFAGERERETLEILMLTRATGKELAVTKLVGIIFAWLILFVLSLPYLWSVGQVAGNFWPAVKYLSITGTSLVITFGGLALALSAKVKSFRAVLSMSLTIFLFSGSPVLLGPSLRQSAVGQVLDWINPFADALNTLDAVVIDTQGLAQQIPRLALMLGYSLAVLWFLYAATKRVEL